MFRTICAEYSTTFPNTQDEISISFVNNDAFNNIDLYYNTNKKWLFTTKNISIKKVCKQGHHLDFLLFGYLKCKVR